MEVWRIRDVKKTRATCLNTGSSRADVGLATQLPYPVMSLDVNLPAVDHTEMTSNKNRSMQLFLTFYRKALSIATNINLDVYHFCLFSNLRAMGGLDRSTHPLIKEKRSTIYVDKYSASFRCNGLEPFAKM